jgi:hypothetical protein
MLVERLEGLEFVGNLAFFVKIVPGCETSRRPMRTWLFDNISIPSTSSLLFLLLVRFVRTRIEFDDGDRLLA